MVKGSRSQCWDCSCLTTGPEHAPVTRQAAPVVGIQIDVALSSRAVVRPLPGRVGTSEPLPRSRQCTTSPALSRKSPLPGNYSGTDFRLTPRSPYKTGLPSGLENRRGESLRGFESHPLRSSHASRTQSQTGFFSALTQAKKE